jgi:hypothetical protein
MLAPALAMAVGGWGDLIWRLGSLALGVWLLVAAVRAAVGVMLVPRPDYTLLAALVGKATNVMFRAAARRTRSYFLLDRMLAAQGPATVLSYLALFLAIFVLAFALIFYGIGGSDFVEAVAQAGSGMTTLGFEAVRRPLTLFVMFVAAFLGSTVIAVFIGFLLTLYAAYTAREAGISELALLTGEPAWGPEMVVRTRRVGDTPTANDVEGWISWMCAMRVNQYIYPLLNHFRSPVPSRHWVTSLLALLDAVAIRLSAMDEQPLPSLVRFLAEGANTMHMLRRSETAFRTKPDNTTDITAWRFESEILSSTGPAEGDPCVTRAEWDAAMDFLAANKVSLQADREAAWNTFARLRAHYAPPACFLADTLFAVPAPWSGPRPSMRHFKVRTVWPQLAAQAGFGKS